MKKSKCVIVLSCSGAPYGDLSLVRALGQRGVYVVLVSEDEMPPAARSKYCKAQIVIESFADAPSGAVEAIRNFALKCQEPPLVLPSADPDLLFLAKYANELYPYVRSVVMEPELVALLANKNSFHGLADRLGLNVPRTYNVKSFHDLDVVWRDASFPIIAKPSTSKAWADARLSASVRGIKALRIETREEFESLYDDLNLVAADTIFQEYIPGGDEEHFDVQMYVDKNGDISGVFCGRKLRMHPPHEGSGTYIESVSIPELESDAASMVKRMGYRGLIDIDYKRHSTTGEYKLLEINPRLGHWSIFCARTGVDLAWSAYLDYCGMSSRVDGFRRIGKYYVNEYPDLVSARIYIKEGAFGWGGYLKSVLKFGVIRQLFQANDLMPFVDTLNMFLKRRWSNRK